MISAADFKKQISKPFAEQMKQLGFKGSGFHYLMDAEKVVFAVGIQANQYSGSCCSEFGIQPKGIERNGIENPDLKKLKYYQCELRTRLSPRGHGDWWWHYSEQGQENIQIINQIVNIVLNQVMPVIQLFRENPGYLEALEPADLTRKNLEDKFLGMNLMMSDVKLAWGLAKAFSKSNPAKAKTFAKYGLSRLEDSSPFMGRRDFEEIMAQNNS